MSTETTETTEKPKRTPEENRQAKLATATKAVGTAKKVLERAKAEHADVTARIGSVDAKLSAARARVTSAQEAYKLAHILATGKPADENDPNLSMEAEGTDEPADSEPADDDADDWTPES